MTQLKSVEELGDISMKICRLIVELTDSPGERIIVLALTTDAMRSTARIEFDKFRAKAVKL